VDRASLGGRTLAWLTVKQPHYREGECGWEPKKDIRDAMFRDYRCVLLEDCAAEPIGHGLSRSNHEASLLAIQLLFGWISSSADLIRALKRSDG
jgi:hypothetical protein